MNIITFHDEHDARQAMANDALARKIGAHITKKYPDRRWMVQIVDNGRVCRLQLPQISTKYGTQFRVMDMPEFNLKKAERYAGEMLERFNLTRGRSDNSDMLSINKAINGEAVGAKHGDISANKPALTKVNLLGANGKPLTGVQINA